MINQVIKLSKLYAPTLKEDPTDADIVSHKLLLRAGMIRRSSTGVYTYLPLGKRVLSKVENIVREEMDGIGAQEITMPALQSAELWHESGRWNDYGPELMRLCDRHNREYCLGPTHEELLTATVHNELRSYKQLPLSVYQIQVKFRDEIRPRFGLLRSREFMMKDAYSFHASEECLDKTYEDMSAAYQRICTRFALEFRPVAADSGQIGGSETCEYMALADSGEADLVYCDCGYAANTEVSTSILHPVEYAGASSMQKISTPDVHTIAELSAFLDIEENATVKALSGKGADGHITVLFVPGDHEVNLLKVENLIDGFELLTDVEMKDAGLHKGSMGPVGLPEGVSVIACTSLKNIERWVVGANEDGYHYVGACQAKDFKVDTFADISMARAGDICCECGRELQGARGIEVAQVFKLGDKYSKTMGAVYSAEDGKDKNFLMGCYGVGISRSLAAIVEQHNDEHGIIWPESVAPALVCVLPLAVNDDVVHPVANDIASMLVGAGVEVAIDDRKERPGVKFAEADLYGWPFQIVVGKRGLEQGEIEIKKRSTSEKISVNLQEFKDAIVSINASEVAAYLASRFD